jgi:hypothetical protein
VEEVQQSLPNFQNTGLGLLELSHRSKAFQGVVDAAVAVTMTPAGPHRKNQCLLGQAAVAIFEDN